MNKLLLSILRPTKADYFLISALMSIIAFGVFATISNGQQLVTVALFVLIDTISVMVLTRKAHRMRFIDLFSHSCWQFAIGMLPLSQSRFFFWICTLSIVVASVVVLMNRKKYRHREILRIKTLSELMMIVAAFCL